jgi:D,D-heptose 1,7-bisphosphate phosphatase
MMRAVFLDRDGVISEEVGYLSDVNQLQLIPEAAQAVHLLNATGLKVIIITNQSGVARGFFSEAQVREVHREMEKMLSAQRAYIDAIYYCPHYPAGIVEHYRRECDCRKPSPGMLARAADEHDIDLTQSYLVGDKLTDVECAQRVGVRGVLVLTGYGKEEETKLDDASSAKPVFIAQNLFEAAQWIIEDYRGGKRGDTDY